MCLLLMKLEHTSAKGIRLVVTRHLLHLLQMCESPGDYFCPSRQNLHACLWLQQRKEGHTCVKLRLAAGNLQWKFAQEGLQNFNTTVGQVVDVAVWFALLPLHFALHSTHLLETLQRRVE